MMKKFLSKQVLWLFISILSFVTVFNSNCENVEQIIAFGMKNQEASIDLKNQRVPVKKLSETYKKVIYDNPDLFYVSNEFNCIHNNSIVLKLKPSYLYNKTITKSMTKLFNSVANDIVNRIDKSLPDIDKALLTHDILAQSCRYDISNNKNQLSYSAYGVFINKVAVCQGYSLAYKYILNKLGIPCTIVSSKSMKHAWNLVKIKNNYYHVDVTWDSCMNSNIGIVKHSNFMRGEAGIRKTGHTGNDWVVNNASVKWSSSDLYDESRLDKIASAVHYMNKEYYYLDEKGNLTKNGSIIHNIDSNLWPVFNKKNYYYQGCYSALCKSSNKLYYNTKNAIYMYDTATNECKKVYEYLRNDGYIYGMCMNSDNNLVLHIATQPNDIGTYKLLMLK